MQAMTQNANIKTLKDGSIDFAHYIARSHEIRSNDAHQALATVWRSVRKAAKAMKLCVVRHSGISRSYAAGQPLDRSAHKASVLRTEAYNDNAAFQKTVAADVADRRSASSVLLVL